MGKLPTRELLERLRCRPTREAGTIGSGYGGIDSEANELIAELLGVDQSIAELLHVDDPFDTLTAKEILGAMPPSTARDAALVRLRGEDPPPTREVVPVEKYPSCGKCGTVLTPVAVRWSSDSSGVVGWCIKCGTVAELDSRRSDLSVSAYSPVRAVHVATLGALVDAGVSKRQLFESIRPTDEWLDSEFALDDFEWLDRLRKEFFPRSEDTKAWDALVSAALYGGGLDEEQLEALEETVTAEEAAQIITMDQVFKSLGFDLDKLKLAIVEIVRGDQDAKEALDRIAWEVETLDESDTGIDVAAFLIGELAQSLQNETRVRTGMGRLIRLFLHGYGYDLNDDEPGEPEP